MACVSPSRTSQIDIAERMQSRETLVHVGHVQNHVFHGIHCDSPSMRRGGIGGRACRIRLLAPEQPTDTTNAFHDATRQKDHHDHEQQAERQMPAFAHEQTGNQTRPRFRGHRATRSERLMQRLLVERGKDVLEVLDQ